MNGPTSTNASNAVRKHQTKPQAPRQLLFCTIILAVFAYLFLFMNGSGTNAPLPIVAASTQSGPPATTKTLAAYGQLPLSFEVNRGQAHKSVNFLARGAGYTLALSPTEAVFALARPSDERSQSGQPSLGHGNNNGAAIRAKRDQGSFTAPQSEPPIVLRMKLIGANRGASVEGLEELEGKVNYLIGNDKAQWRTNISTFARVRYAQVYPGIDVVYYGNQKHLEYDFVVAPGRDASAISLKFDGADKVEVDAAGDLLLSIGESIVRQPKPVVYQEISGARRAVEAGNECIDDPAVFVCQQYHDLLMREPEPGGMQFYLDILNGCQSTDTECIKSRRGAISANFFRSPEFQEKGSFVLYLYKITLGQRPATVAELSDSTKIDRPHYTEFMMDLRNISDPNDDKAVVSAMKDALTIAWLQRPEIQAIFGSLTNEQFVKKLESTAGVTLANESTLIANLNNATQTRAQVLRAVAESPEVNAKFYKQAFVPIEYFGYLRRDPEDCHGHPNPSQCGYIFHNNSFNSPGNPSQIEILIVRGFIESPEYRQRFGP